MARLSAGGERVPGVRVSGTAPRISDVNRVKEWQRLLNQAGFGDQFGQPLTEDGLLGPRTEFAMRNFLARQSGDLAKATVADEPPLLVSQGQYKQAKLEVGADVSFEEQAVRAAARAASQPKPQTPAPKLELTPEERARYIQGTGDTSLPQPTPTEQPQNLTTITEGGVAAAGADESVRRNLAAIGLGKVDAMIRVFDSLEQARRASLQDITGLLPSVARVIDPIGAPARWVRLTAAVGELVQQVPEVSEANAKVLAGKIPWSEYARIRDEAASRIYQDSYLQRPEIQQQLAALMEQPWLGEGKEAMFVPATKSLNFIADIAMDPVTYLDIGTQPFQDEMLGKALGIAGAMARRAEGAVAPVVERAAERAMVETTTSRAAARTLKRFLKGFEDLAPEARAGLARLTRDAASPEAVRDALKLYGVEVLRPGELAGRSIGGMARKVVDALPQGVRDLARTRGEIEARKQAEAIPQHVMNVLKTGIDDEDTLRAILNDPVLKEGLKQRGVELADYMARWRKSLSEVRQVWEDAVHPLSEDERMVLMTWMDQGTAIPANMGRVREVGQALRKRLDELSGEFYKEFYSYRGKVPRQFKDFVETWLPSPEGKRPWEFERTVDRPHTNFAEWLDSQIYRDAVGRFDQAAQEMRGLVETTAEFAQARVEQAAQQTMAARIASELGVPVEDVLAQGELAGRQVVGQAEWVAGLRKFPKGTKRFVEQEEWLRSLPRVFAGEPGPGVVDYAKVPAALRADLQKFAQERGMDIADWHEFFTLNPAADAFASEFEKATGHILPRAAGIPAAEEAAGRSIKLAGGRTVRAQFGDNTDRLLFELHQALATAEKQTSKVTPGMARWVGRGKHGKVRVVFPTDSHTNLFAYASRLRKAAKEGTEFDSATEAYLRKWLQLDVKTQVGHISAQYRRFIQDAIKDLPEGTVYAAPTVEDALGITTTTAGKGAANKVAQITREKLASLRGVLKERGIADPDAAAKALGESLRAWSVGEGKQAGAVLVSRDGMRSLAEGERVVSATRTQVAATKKAAVKVVKGALSPEVRAELRRLKMPRSKRANLAVRSLRFMDSLWKDSVLLLRLGWPVRNVIDNAAKTVNEILNAAARGEAFFPVFFGKLTKEVPIPRLLVEGGFHNAQKAIPVYGGVWQKVRDGLYEWMGAKPENFFRNAIYRGKFLAEQARMVKAGIAPETVADLARKYGVDETNRILNNYGNQIMLVHSIGRVSPFFNFRVYNWTYWLKDWAQHPWKLTALLRAREDIRQANADLPEYMRNTVALPDLPFIGPDQRVDPFAIWSYNDIVRLADAQPEWVKEREQAYQEAEDFADTLPADQRTEFWRLNPDLAAYGNSRGIPAVVKFTKWLEMALPLHPLLIRKPLEVIGVLDKQDWRNIFAQSELIRQVTGLDIEKFHHAYLADQDRKAVEQEVSRQKLRGEEPNEARAAQVVREQALRREMRGLTLGIYTKWWTPAHQEYYDASRAIFEGKPEATPAPQEKPQPSYVTPQQVKELRDKGLTEIEARMVADMANRDKHPKEQRDAMEVLLSGYATVSDLQVLTTTPKDRAALERILRKGPNVEDMTTLQRDETMRTALENVLGHKSVAQEYLAKAKTPGDLEALRQQLRTSQVGKDILLQGRSPEERAVYDEIENEFREFAKLSTYAYKDRQLAFQKRQEYLKTHPLLQAVLDQSGTAQEKADRAKLETYYRDYFAINSDRFKNEYGDPDLGAFFAARRQYLKDHPEFQQLQLKGKSPDEQQQLLDRWKKDELWASYPREGTWDQRQTYLKAHPELLEETLKYRPASAAINWSGPTWSEYKGLKTDAERVAWLVGHPERLKEWVLRQQGVVVVFDFEADKQKAWEQYFALSEDKRDAFIRQHPELGVYPLDPTKEEILQRWKEQHPNEAAAAQWYYEQGGKWKAMLDLSTKSGMERFWSSNSEWTRYREEYFKKHPEKRKVMELTRQYWEMPPESRRRFMEQHPELEASWRADASPEDRAMFDKLDRYYAIPYNDKARRRAYMNGNPDLQAWLDARQAKKLEGMLTRLPAINEAMNMWLERTKAQLGITAARPSIYNPKGAVQSAGRPGSRGSR